MPQKLKSLSVVFRWIIVGDGTEREYIATQIADRKLEDVIVLAGYQRNPYPYIMNSDVMISTSLSESYGMAVAESVLLHVPAIAFSYPALTEVIDQGKNGFIIDQGNIDGMVEIIKALYDDRKKLKRLKENCYCKVTVQDAMRQFDSVFDGEDK